MALGVGESDPSNLPGSNGGATYTQADLPDNIRRSLYGFENSQAVQDDFLRQNMMNSFWNGFAGGIPMNLVSGGTGLNQNFGLGRGGPVDPGEGGYTIPGSVAGGIVGGVGGFLLGGPGGALAGYAAGSQLGGKYLGNGDPAYLGGGTTGPGSVGSGGTGPDPNASGSGGSGGSGLPGPGSPLYYGGYQGGAMAEGDAQRTRGNIIGDAWQNNYGNPNQQMMSGQAGTQLQRGQTNADQFIGMGSGNADTMGLYGRMYSGTGAGYAATGAGDYQNQQLNRLSQIAAAGQGGVAGNQNLNNAAIYGGQAQQQLQGIGQTQGTAMGIGSGAGAVGSQNFNNANQYGGQAQQQLQGLSQTQGTQMGIGSGAGGVSAGNQGTSNQLLGNAQQNQNTQGRLSGALSQSAGVAGAAGVQGFGASQNLLGRSNQDYNSQAGARGQTEGALSRLQNFYQQGPGPSAAQAQLAQSADQNMANAVALAHSGRGNGVNSAALRNATFTNAATQQQLGGQMAQLRANEDATWRGQKLSAMGQEQGALSSMRGQDISTLGQNLGAAQGFQGLGLQGTGQQQQALSTLGSQNLQQQGMNLSSAGQFAGLGYQGMGLQAQQANTIGSQQLSQLQAMLGAQSSQTGLGYQGLGLQAQQANTVGGQQISQLQSLLGAQSSQGGLGYQGLGLQQSGLGQVSQQDLAAMQQNNQMGLGYSQLGQGYQNIGLQNQLGFAGLGSQQLTAADQNALQYQQTGLQNQLGYAGLANSQYQTSDQLRNQILSAQLQSDTARYGADRGVQVGMAQLDAQKQAADMQFWATLGAAGLQFLKPDGKSDGKSGSTNTTNNNYGSGNPPPPPAYTPPPPEEVPLPPSDGGYLPDTPSDIRLKKKIQAVDGGDMSDGAQDGKPTVSGRGVDLRPAQGFSYEYKDPNSLGAPPGRHYGPMAQDLEKTPAGASVVRTGPDGMKRIDTNRLSLVNTSAISEAQRRQDTQDSKIDRLYSMLGKAPPPAANETTALSPEQESAFQAWAKKNRIRDVDHPDSHYDYRGAYLAGMRPGPDAHWPDTYKQHGHETFSNESQYAAPGDKSFGYWNDNDKFVRPLPPADLDASYERQAQDTGPLSRLRAMAGGR